MASIPATLFAASTRPFEPAVPRTVQPRIGRRHANAMTTSAMHDRKFGGRNIVDENMIVLRKRIREVERDGADEPPAGWMEWEKRIYPSYDMIVCDAMRLLQSYLMATRPSFALGVVGLVALSVPIAGAAVVLSLLELSGGILSSLNLN